MNADSFHRLAKIFADSGEAETVEKAQATLANYGVRILLNEAFKEDVAAQIIALTAINCASRSFMGNVRIEAACDTMPLIAPGFAGTSLRQFCAWAGVHSVNDGKAQQWPVIEIGDVGKGQTGETVRPWADGWTYGINGKMKRNGAIVPPACVAAGGLAVSEAFSLLRRDNPYAGRRSLTLSLWNPQTLGPAAELGPVTGLEVPPAWLVGLGHLGQAYAWTLGFMSPAPDATFFLQDVDEITASTPSTSVLSTQQLIDHNKTRVVAAWLEARGFRTALVERRFDQFQRVGASEPRTALFGVDNPAARRVFEGTGFSHVIDAGLGSGYRDFRGMRIRTFPGPSKAADLWAVTGEAPDIVQAPAYKELLHQGADPCGVTTLATRAVGAPFVGCVGAAYVIAALMRRKFGQEAFAVIDMNLRDPSACEALRESL